jgi:hypothetical protein
MRRRKLLEPLTLADQDRVLNAYQARPDAECRATRTVAVIKDLRLDEAQVRAVIEDYEQICGGVE